MSKHTPGPWKVEPSQSGSSFTIRAKKMVASVGVRAPWFEPESQANAKLIAAAPEMLQALKTVAAILTTKTFSGTDNNPLGIRDLIGSAISKADGR